MRFRAARCAISFFLLLTVLSSAVNGAPPAVIAFQGRLASAGGQPVPDGAHSVTFRLYDRASGGEALWFETKPVTATKGVFSTALGDTRGFPDTLVFDRPYFLGVQVAGDPEMTPRLPLAAAPYALGTAAAPTGPDAPPDASGSPLAGLSKARAGRARQQGSRDPSGGNHDFRSLEPGQTITLFDEARPGIIQRFWCTIAPRADMALHAQTILRMYWDGESTPSVEVPIGAFFGVGFGQQVDYTSLPLNETSGGYNCYWEMPFRSARWTLTNLSSKRLDAFYYNVDYTAYDTLPDNLQRFHAQWRRENPTTRGRNYTLLEASGAGHFVGAALFMQNRQGKGLGFLEGDEMIYVDGEAAPSIYGTGTEDYFSSGWYFDRGTYSAPYHGVVIKDTQKARISAYRWHVEDPKPFQSSIRVTVEHGTNNDTEGDYSSVAYWYQDEPHAGFPPLPQDPALLLPVDDYPPYKIPNALEGEMLAPHASVSNGPVSAQDMSIFGTGWSDNAQLWWRPGAAGATLLVDYSGLGAGTYDVTGYFTRARDYGTAQISLNGSNVGPVLNLYGPDVVPTGPVSLGRITMPSSQLRIRVDVTGKDPASEGYMFGLDALVLTPVN